MKTIWEFFVELYYSFTSLPFEASIASLLVLFNCVFFSFLLIVLFVLRRKSFINKKISIKLSSKLNKFYKDTLCDEAVLNDAEILSKYNEIIGKPSTFKTNLSIDVLFRMEKCERFNFSNYNRMIELLSFDTFLIKKASFSSGIMKYKVLNVVKELGVKSIDSFILPFAFSKNKRIRKEARFSYLLISENNPYRFFDEVKDDITYWDSIELMRLLEKLKQKGKLQNLGKWVVSSENTSLTIFLIKAIAYFKQYEAKDIIINKLEDKNPDVRAVSIEAIGALNIKTVEKILIKKYPNEVGICQRAIIRAIKNFDTGQSLGFLKKTYIETTEKELETTIANTIYTYKDGLGLFEELKNTLNESKQIILNHVETPLIKFKEYA